MIPNKKRAQRLDDRLRELGFHARASGIYGKATPAVSSSATSTGEQQAKSKFPGKVDEPNTAGKKRRGRGGSAGSSRPLTQEERQESMAKMVESCKKKKKSPGTPGGASDTEQR